MKRTFSQRIRIRKTLVEVESLEQRNPASASIFTDAFRPLTFILKLEAQGKATPEASGDADEEARPAGPPRGREQARRGADSLTLLISASKLNIRLTQNGSNSSSSAEVQATGASQARDGVTAQVPLLATLPTPNAIGAPNEGASPGEQAARAAGGGAGGGAIPAQIRAASPTAPPPRGSSQAGGGGVAGLSGAGADGGSAAGRASSPPPAIAQPSSSIRPLSLSLVDLAGTASRGTVASASFSSGGGNVIPNVAFAGSTNDEQAFTNEPDPVNSPGVFQEYTNVVDVIGGSASVSVFGGPGTYSSITFTISGHAYGDVTVDSTGFTTPGYTSSTGTSDVTHFYWDQEPGVRTIDIDVVYANNDTGHAAFTVDVQGVTGGMTPDVLRQPGILTSPTTQLSSSSDGTNAIIWGATATAPPTSGGATIGCIQTIAPFLVERTAFDATTEERWVDPGTGGIPSRPRPVVDDGLGIFYGSTSGSGWTAYGTLDAITGATTTAVADGDTPSVGLDSTFAAYHYDATFTVELMYKPNDGVWVPLGMFTWDLDMSTTNAGAITSTRTVWNPATYTPTTHSNYTANTTYPTWADSASRLYSFGWV